MVSSALESDRQSSSPASSTGKLSPATPQKSESTSTATCVDREEIARLSDSTIQAMSREDLLNIVCSHGIPFADPEQSGHYQYQELTTLRRLVALVRQCCRNAE